MHVSQVSLFLTLEGNLACLQVSCQTIILNMFNFTLGILQEMANLTKDYTYRYIFNLPLSWIDCSLGKSS